MTRSFFRVAVATVGVLLLIQTGDAQRPGRRPGQRARPAASGPNTPRKDWPNDKKLFKLYVDFVNSAEKLAKEYEQKDEHEKAQDVYREILKIVPEHARSKKKIEEFFVKEATAERKVLEVRADQAWQDSGIRVIQGKPITIRSTGTWTFAMSHKLDSKGMQIPKELKAFNLGSLIGAVAVEDAKVKQGKPFAVGEGTKFIAQQSGRLMFRMYDADPSDNSGKLKVEVVGTFESK